MTGLRSTRVYHLVIAYQTPFCQFYKLIQYITYDLMRCDLVEMINETNVLDDHAIY